MICNKITEPESLFTTQMEFLNLASGASHFNSPAAAISGTIAALKNNQTFYGDPEGLTALREALKKRYLEDYKVEIPVANILITSGTKQAIFNLLFVLCKPGDEVILPQPSWFAFPEMFELLQLKPVYWETFPEENYELKPEKLEALLTEKTRLIIISNPNNPSGKVYAKSEIETLLKVLEKYPQVKIISDEIYDLVLFDEVKMPSILEFQEVKDKAIVVNGFSKNFGMSGWRVGYLIAPPEIFEKCLYFQHATISGVNPFIQEGCVAALENRKEFREKTLETLTENRGIVKKWLEKNNAVSAYIPDGGYYFFMDFRKIINSEKSLAKGIHNSAGFFNFLKENYKLDLQAGDRFHKPGFARFTFAVPTQTLKAALERLDLILKDCF